ncbi:MAG: peptidoglycan DD-metalloendopeptidase family protein [Proteobacteria bacterium]|nr:peptidoglycan DD-metalloendopeptidase family protein [Cystobacterineae bacterium]MCL2258968.1 peptidoglycan DD-metalloendopeptidase family protein [Cystobacterineae bacterium]MCL2314675.1 peptidoglycan DD-metalloendopeptidase family protein [Pseudomonadota bacterium]
MNIRVAKVVLDFNERHERRRGFGKMRFSWPFWLVGGIGLLGGFFVFQHTALQKEQAQGHALRAQYIQLESEMLVVRRQFEQAQKTLARVDALTQRLNGNLLNEDSDRRLALGPTDWPERNVIDFSSTAFEQMKPADLKEQLEAFQVAVESRETSLERLYSNWLERRLRWASTPSIWPVRGWVTSRFGGRTDPLTGRASTHMGLDIAGPHGKDIVSTADGTVVFAGMEGAYGKVVVVDHGYGMKSRYAHLASIVVSAGDVVKRGDVIGQLGNTGRSTGSHLHYEIRLNGVPQNPRNYILD